MLEVIDKGSATEAHPVPLLFVHGGYHAAWCWNSSLTKIGDRASDFSDGSAQPVDRRDNNGVTGAGVVEHGHQSGPVRLG